MSPEPDERPIDRAFVQEVRRSVASCYVCGWDSPPMMREEAEAAAIGHNVLKHPEAMR